jgi:hypothetical protein
LYQTWGPQPPPLPPTPPPPLPHPCPCPLPLCRPVYNPDVVTSRSQRSAPIKDDITLRSKGEEWLASHKKHVPADPGKIHFFGPVSYRAGCGVGRGAGGAAGRAGCPASPWQPWLVATVAASAHHATPATLASRQRNPSPLRSSSASIERPSLSPPSVPHILFCILGVDTKTSHYYSGARPSAASAHRAPPPLPWPSSRAL